MSIRNYNYSLRNDPEERSTQCTVEVLMTTMKTAVLHDVTPCSLVNSFQRFGGISCRYLQGNRPSFGMLYIGVMSIGVNVSE